MKGQKKKAQAVLIVTGSEVQLALRAQEVLAFIKIALCGVFLPVSSPFDLRDAACKASVLPPGVLRIAAEMGVSCGWWQNGCAAAVGIDT